jgi:cell division protease FtsH
MLKNLVIWLVIGLVLMTVFNQFNTRQAAAGADGVFAVPGRGEGRAHRQGHHRRPPAKATTAEGKRVTSYSPGDIWLVSDLLKFGVKIEAKPEEEPSLLMNIFVSWFPMLLLIGVWIFFMRQMQGGGRGGAFSFGKSRARMLDESTNTVTFADVAGLRGGEGGSGRARRLPARPLQVPEARRPHPARRADGRQSPAPARRCSRARSRVRPKVPFFSISGSDFVEMFVGVGAARVRDMFEQAKKHAPCIVFIDEIDAVGRQRGAGLGGGNDEREQTLNQLLVEMDGFEATMGVIVIAATNRPGRARPGAAAPGPLRPPGGRAAARHPRPRGNPQGAHAQGAALARTSSPTSSRAAAPGFLGRDLANLVNEAALFAARGNKRLVEMDDFERAKDKIIMGAERPLDGHARGRAPQHRVPRVGHAIVARLLPKTDPVHKVTIIPRGRALGVTMQLPTEDRYSQDREPAAQHDRGAVRRPDRRRAVHAPDDHRRFERLRARTEIARRMVTQWGMSTSSAPWSTARTRARSSSAARSRRTRTSRKATMQKVDSRSAHHRQAVRGGAQAPRRQPR